MGGAGGAGKIGVGSAFPNGIGAEWKWKTGVVAHTAGPYTPCGIVGAGLVTFGAANPTAPEIAAASRAGVVLFFSLDTGARARTPFYAGGPVSGVDFSRDGTRLVVAGDTGVQVVRLVDGKVLFSAQPFAFSARAAALSPDGSLIAALGWDSPQTTSSPVFFLRLLRVSDGTSIAETGIEAMDSVPPQFSPDGSLLAAGSELLSVPDLQALPPLGFSPPQIVLSPDGTKAAQGGHVVDLASGVELKKLILGQEGHFVWSAFSLDGATYAESFDEIMGSTIHLWRTSDWTPIGTPTPIGGRFFFSGDGKRIITGGSRDSLGGADHVVFQIMNFPELTPGPAIVEPQFGWSPVVPSPDGSLIMGVLTNSTSGVWRTADLSPLPRMPEGSPPYGFLGNGMLQIDTSIFNPLDGTKLGYAIGDAISPDGRLAVVSSPYPSTSVIRLADLTTQAVLATGALHSPLGLAWAFSRDNRFVAVVGMDPTNDPQVIVFDAMTGTALATLAGVAPIAIATTPSGAVRVAAFVPGPPFPADVRVWSVPDGKPLFDIVQATAKDWSPSGHMPTMDFSPDGSLIAAGAKGIRIFQVETGVLRETLPAHFDPPISGGYTGVLSLAFSATGQIASVGWDGTMRLWCSP